MFGRDDNQQQSADNSGMMQAAMPDPVTDSSSPITPPASPIFTPTTTEATTEPAAPAMPDLSSFGQTPAVSTPDTTLPADSPTEPSDSSPLGDTPLSSSPASADDLMSLKQQAMQQLSPLVGHLDQTPEEKFRTTMMMIQASDDQSLIKTAYDAAQQITDDKARAQALLDVINEINYFTQHTTASS